MSYPFAQIAPSKELIEKIRAVESSNNYDALIADIRRRRQVDASDMTLLILLSWALTQNVKVGIHIDNLLEDMTEAKALFKTFRVNYSEALEDDILDYEVDMQTVFERAKAFDF